MDPPNNEQDETWPMEVDVEEFPVTHQANLAMEDHQDLFTKTLNMNNADLAYLAFDLPTLALDEDLPPLGDGDRDSDGDGEGDGDGDGNKEPSDETPTPNPSGKKRATRHKTARKILKTMVDRARSGGSGNGGGDPDDDDPDPYSSITFKDVAGLDEQRDWLQNNVMRIIKDETLQSYGFCPPKGVLLYGPPGTGKTLIVRAAGNEISAIVKKKVSFYNVNCGSLKSKFIGGSERQVRELFRQAKETSPSIIFMDEIDGICPSRGGRTTGHAATTLVNSILGEMDTIKPGEIFVFGATNRLDSVDPAIRRSGRFDQHLKFHLPSLDVRKRIVALYTLPWPRTRPTQALLHEIGDRTAGFTGSDLEALCHDVFWTAVDRHIPEINKILAVKDQDFDPLGELKVQREDWDRALGKAKSSATSAFGGHIYIPKATSVDLQPLIRGTQAKLMEAMQPLLPKPTENPKVLPQTFFIWNEQHDSSTVLETFLLPGIFADQRLSDYPVFSLTKSGLMGRRPIILIEEVTTAAAASGGPCIFFIPSLEKISKYLGHNAKFLHAAIMREFTGKPILVVATGRHPPIHLSDVNFRCLFASGKERTYEVPKLPMAPRLQFLRPVFKKYEEKWEGTTPESKRENMENWIRQEGTRTEGSSILAMIKLRDSLAHFAALHASHSGKTFILAMVRIFREFSKSRLQLDL